MSDSYLIFDGVDDRMGVTIPVLNGTWALEINVKSDKLNSSAAIGTSDDNSFNQLISMDSSGGLRWRFNGSETTLGTGIDWWSDFVKLRLECDGSNTKMYINDVLKATSGRTVFSQIDNIGGAFRNSGNNYPQPQRIKYIKVEDPLNTLIHHWSSDDSSHDAGQVILNDIVGDSHATGFNFPTDGSAWGQVNSSVDRLANSLSIAVDLNERKANQDQLTVDILSRVSSATSVSFETLFRRNNSVNLSFDLESISEAIRLSSSIDLSCDLAQRKSNLTSVSIDVLSRKTRSLSIATAVLRKLANDVSILADLLQRNACVVLISLDLIARKNNQFLITFTVDGEAGNKVSLRPIAQSRVQLSYLADDSAVVRLTPIQPTRVKLQ